MQSRKKQNIYDLINELLNISIVKNEKAEQKILIQCLKRLLAKMMQNI